jgi:hypothetical protein
MAPAPFQARGAAAAATATGQAALLSPQIAVLSSNMREPLLRAAVAAVSSALAGPGPSGLAGAVPLRETARRIKDELELLPRRVTALASAEAAAAELLLHPEPAVAAQGAACAADSAAGSGAAEGFESPAAEGARQEEPADEQHQAGEPPASSSASAASATAAPPSYPSKFSAARGGAAWQVALGTCFGSAVSFETRGFAHMRAGPLHVLIWRSTAPSPAAAAAASMPPLPDSAPPTAR